MNAPNDGRRNERAALRQAGRYDPACWSCASADRRAAVMAAFGRTWLCGGCAEVDATVVRFLRNLEAPGPCVTSPGLGERVCRLAREAGALAATTRRIAL